jgi:hypothetical protein
MIFGWDCYLADGSCVLVGLFDSELPDACTKRLTFSASEPLPVLAAVGLMIVLMP